MNLESRIEVGVEIGLELGVASRVEIKIRSWVDFISRGWELVLELRLGLGPRSVLILGVTIEARSSLG